MLNKAKTLKGYRLQSRDGEIGSVKEFYFDDRHWATRYLVVETGNWLTNVQVLISPYAIIAVNKEKHEIAIDLTKKQIEDSPSLDTDKPVSRQFEVAYNVYYGFPGYWEGPYMWGSSYLVRDLLQRKESNTDQKTWNSHLRSTREVSSYHIQAADGKMGHVEDFLIDDKTWAIRYLIVDTRNWWPAKKVLISPQWIKRVSWGESKVFVNLSRETIKGSPEYAEGALPTRDYETKLHQHYGRQIYWENEPLVRDLKNKKIASKRTSR